MRSKHIALIIVVLIVIGLGYGALTGAFINKETDGNSLDSFAQCLTDKGAVMYGAYWCSHCQNQKAMFGDSFQYVNYVECTEQGDLCQEAGITGYPTWIINGNKYPGEKTLEELASLSGCEL